MHTSNELRSILDKLASDDKFRTQLQADPVATLAKLGITLSADQVPDHISLPSKADIAVEQHELQRELETTAAMIPFLLSGALVAA
ncbi:MULTISPECIES: NHLP-related RiPP peptide [Duganella]|jgi:putative modified peptide|uniref:Modified peptide n=2 Tax=Duganella TaxID=75654 RepID=A0ABX6MEU3_9BURK|nr:MULTISPECIES: NHLP-related RiPP peptide [Duganella]MYN30271.1 putative modified peptide [Duganella levis]QJD92860.1 putative modified peptide [Duganella dendranthematis]